MKKRNKMICLLLAGLLVVSTLFGCGSSDDTKPEVDTATEDAVVENTEDVEEDASTEIEPCTIYVLTNATADAENLLYEDLAAAFNEKYPDITVELQSGGTDYYSVLATKINAGEVPDIFITMGYKDCDVYSDYIYDITQDSDLNALYEAMDQSYADAVTDSNGKVCGVASGFSAYGYVYNKDLFEQAGIEAIPTTYDEMVEVCEKLVAAGITPFANGYKEWWIYKHSFSSFVGESFASFDEMAAQLTDGTTTFSDLDKMDAMFDLLDLTLEYGVDKQMELDATTATTAFANGEAAMTNQGTWQYDTFLSVNPDMNLGFIPEPIGNDASLSKISTAASGTYSISADTENFEAVKAFYMFMVDYLCTTEDGVNIKTLPQENTDASLLTNKLVLEGLEAESTRGWAQNQWPSGFETEFGTLLQEYSIGNMSRAEVLEEMQSAWLKLS